MSLVDELRIRIAEGLRDKSLTSCSRWASARRMMDGDFAGPYSTRFHPWCKGMMDSSAPFNYAIKAAQLGVTEVGINRAFYGIDQLGHDVLYVLPTTLNAADFSKARFNPALELSPYLKRLFTDADSIALKRAGKHTLYIRGSRGDSNLKSIPVSELILDEVDEMSERAINLAKERLSGHINTTVWGISTPTLPNHGIHKLYQNSTKEHFFFKCPCCGRRTELVWPNCVEIIGESAKDPRCHESFLKCKECKGRLPVGPKNQPEIKADWLASGEWQVTDHAANPDFRGFYINQLYSPTVTIGNIVVKSFEALVDEYAAQEFNNSKLGLPFVGQGAKVTEEMIQAAIGNYTMDSARPLDATRLITLGIDQGNLCHWVAVEWLIKTFGNDLNAHASARVIGCGKFYEQDWENGAADQLMREWQARACVVDADPQISEARRFSHRFPGFVWLCRYRKGKTNREIDAKDYEGAPMATVDRTNWLSTTLGRFRTRRIQLPQDVPEEFRDHMQALVRTYKKDETGNPVASFVDTAPDHYAHALNYAEIALVFAASLHTGQDIEAFW